MDKVIPSMLGFEKLKDEFNAGGEDTAGIVQLAMQYNLLTDYTALIALEPNDTLHNPQNPSDTPPASAVPHLSDESAADSLMLQTYPNPFNSRMSIVVNIQQPSILDICVFNILGQLVKVITSNEMIIGKKVYFWNGTNDDNQIVNSGVYFVRLIAKELNSGQTILRLRKVQFLK